MARLAGDALIGRTLAGKYVIESFIGGGAMGAVYRAKQLSLDKSVAIKVLHGDLVGDRTFIARFQREAKAASRLDHPNSVRVLDYGRDDDGLCYIAMELLEGQSLFALLRDARGPLPDERSVDLLRQVLAALAVAHEMGVVHRDLKPENIIVLQSKSDDGQVTETVKVCDFGMAKILAGESALETSQEKLTSHGVILGTPEYMSPEQCKGEDLDARSDLYSVGVILYQMLTGKLPFQADTPIATVLKHLVEVPKPPSQLALGCNPRLEPICLRALEKLREDRFASAREMRAALRDALTDGAHIAPPEEPQAETTAPRLRPLVDPAAEAVPATHVPVMEPPPVRWRLAAEVLASGVEPRRTPPPLLIAAVAVLSVVVGGVVALRLRRAPVAVVQAASPPETHDVSLATSVESVRGTAPAMTPPVPALSEPSPWGEARREREKSPLVPVAPASKVGWKPPDAAAEAASVGAPSRPSSSRIASAAGRGAPPPSPEQTPAPLATALVPPPPLALFGRASVSFGPVRTSHAQPSDVLAALPGGRFNQCYRDELRAQASPVRGTGTLRLGFGTSGHVGEASFVGPPDLAAVGQCIANSAVGSDVRNVESGATGAEVDLSFKPD